MNYHWQPAERENPESNPRQRRSAYILVALSIFGSVCAGSLLGAVLGGWWGVQAGYAAGTDDGARLLGALVEGVSGLMTGTAVGGGLGLGLSLGVVAWRAKQSTTDLGTDGG